MTSYKQYETSTASSNSQSRSFIKFPIELMLNTAHEDEILLSKNVIQFYNLDSQSSGKRGKKSHQINSMFKCNKIIEYLNFVRLNKNMTEEGSSNDQSSPLGFNKIPVSTFSLILLANNKNNITETVNDSYENYDAWSYHYKVELNDELGRILARQLFYSMNASRFPLCCNSNWTTPTSSNKSTSPTKYIIRLNINCQNFDLMLFFYRLLLVKYPNYSKKNFTMFVLLQDEYTTSQGETMLVEFQLSLKYDPDVRVDKQSASSSLVYNMYDQTAFSNLLGLLDGFLEEIVYNKVYSVTDPDSNRIYLVNRSSPVMPKFMQTVGLGERYMTSIYTSLDHQLNSPTVSNDSSKDSGQWSYMSNLKSNGNCTSSGDDSETFNYKNMHIIENYDDQSSTSSPKFSGVKDLIKKFDSNVKLNINSDDDDQTTTEAGSILVLDDRSRMRSTSMRASLANKFRPPKPNSLKKSKSVTFLDSIDQIEEPERVMTKRASNPNICRINITSSAGKSDYSSKYPPPRPRSTVPQCFVASESDDDDDSSILIAHVDDSSSLSSDIDVRTSRHQRVHQFRPSCLIDDKKLSNKRRTNQSNKPSVGITPQTRFRRSHTLNMIRNSRMPLPQSSGRRHDFQLPTNNLMSHHQTLFKYPIAKF